MYTLTFLKYSSLHFPGRSFFLFLLVFAFFHSICYSQTYPSAYNPGLQVNHVRSWEAYLPITDPTKIAATTTVDSVRMTTQYFDGLGRPVQQVLKEFSPAKKDMVAPNVYDAMGREAYQYLPFIANSTGANTSISNGQFKYNPFQQDSSFNKSMYPGESYFYTYNYFEGSPLNRIKETYAPGNNWSGTAAQVSEANRHGMDLRYGSNAVNDSVKYWQVTIGAIGSFSTYSSSVYAAGQLTKLIKEDEIGGEIIEFTDKMGKLVLRKQLLNAPRDMGPGSNGHIGWLNTYYMYDVLGNLRCVLQPEGLRLYMAAGGTGNLTDTAILNQQCFRYEYDGKRRMIMKKTPGSYKQEFVYDKRDRLSMYRDSSLAKQSFWMVNKYDSLNRIVKIGLQSNGSSRATHQTSADADNSFSYPTLIAGDVMQENYYDNYSWITAPTPQAGIQRTLTAGDISGSFFFTTYNSAPDYAQQVVADTLNVHGLLTGTKVRILGSGTYLYSVTFYDSKARVIQQRGGNITSGGYDIISTQYNFEGKPLRILHRQEKGGAAARYIRELTKLSYDHMGRVKTVVKKVGSSGTDKTVASNTYDELGRLKTKIIGNNQEIQNMEYNVRSWSIGMNRGYVKGDSLRKFGYELGYDNAASIVSPGTYNAEFRGNIGGTTWRSAGDGEKRKYKYSYDPAHRLMKAEFTQYNPGSVTFDNSAGIDFTTTMGNGIIPDSAYDANGNIKRMTQFGLKGNSSTLIDDLRYSYISKTNKLSKVIDTVVNGNYKLADFVDGINSGDDYSYDVNGNLTEDKNKGITSILYNHLNLPYEMRIGGKGKITYVYDNQGIKWKKTVVDSTTTPNPTTTTWLYLNNFVYKNDTIQFFGHEEGRARYDTSQTTPEATAFLWDYFLRDHLGNVRMVLTEEKDTVKYVPLTFEGVAGSSMVQDQDEIWENKSGASINVVSSRISRPGAMGDTTTNGHNVMLVRKSTGAIGAGKLLKVMAGDRIHASIDYYYSVINSNNTGASGINSLTTNIANAIANSLQVSQALKNTASAIATDLSGVSALATLLNTPNNTSGINNAPKAYLNIITFNEQFKYEAGASQVIPVPYSNVKGTISRMFGSAVNIVKNGYVYLYFSNESDEMVYFDNFILSHEKGPITEENHYYSFGLTMAGISSKAIGMVQNKFGFNGNEVQNKEFSDGSGLDAYDFNFRTYDQQIGRFWQKDPLSAFAPDHSPYSFVQNNPVLFIDPQGLDTVRVNGKGSHKIKVAKGDVLAWTIGETTSYFTYDPGNENAVSGFVGEGMDEGTLEPVTVTPNSSNSSNYVGFNFPTRDQAMWGVDAGFSIAETSRSTFRLAKGNSFSPKLYQGGWRGGGRAGIKTFKVASAARAGGSLLFGVSIVMDLNGVNKYYKSASDPDAIHPANAGLNTAMGIYSLRVNPIVGALYFGYAAFYPGGWQGYAKDYERNQKANQEILGPQFITAPFGSQKF